MYISMVSGKLIPLSLWNTHGTTHKTPSHFLYSHITGGRCLTSYNRQEQLWSFYRNKLRAVSQKVPVKLCSCYTQTHYRNSKFFSVNYSSIISLQSKALNIEKKQMNIALNLLCTE